MSNQFQLIFAAVHRGDSRADQGQGPAVLPTSSTYSTSAASSQGTQPIPRSRHHHRDLFIPKLSAKPKIWKQSPGCSVRNCRPTRLTSPTSRHSGSARTSPSSSSSCSRDSPPSSRPSATTNRIGEYLDEQRSHQIEHIWANHVNRCNLVKNTAAFDKSRNRFGALLLLRRSDNASYRDEPYSAKVEYYRGGQNLLRSLLHPTTHTRNPTFSRFSSRSTNSRPLCDRTQRTSTTAISGPPRSSTAACARSSGTRPVSASRSWNPAGSRARRAYTPAAV